MHITQNEWWRGAAIYQIYPRSFADSNADGIGDLPGITQRLDYVASLGVDGIWLSPFFPSPMRDFGYDVSNHCDVDPMFGSLADFDALLARAHALGLKVIIDQVWSHTAMEHQWFQESRQSRTNAFADWYVWADAKADGSPPSNWQSWMGGAAWTWEPRRQQYYLHNFLREMPDLNFHCEDVQAAILGIARFWLDRGVDGFRMDTANFYFHSRGLEDNPPQPGDRPVMMQRHIHNVCQPENLPFLSRLRAVLDAYDARISVAEIGSDNNLARMIEYTTGTERLHTAYSFVMLGDRHDPEHIQAQVTPWEQDAGISAWPSWAFSNHDVTRVASRWAEVKPMRCQQLLALLACLRGTIFLYQGEELGLPQSDVPFENIQDPFGKAHWPVNKGRDGCRTPMPWLANEHEAGFTGGVPWLPVDAAHRPLAVDVQEVDADSTLHFARRVLSFRRKYPALRLGAFTPLHVDHQVLVILRVHAGESVLAAFNLGHDTRNIELPGEHVTCGESLMVGNVNLHERQLHMTPWSALIVPVRSSQ